MGNHPCQAPYCLHQLPPVSVCGRSRCSPHLHLRLEAFPLAAPLGLRGPHVFLLHEFLCIVAWWTSIWRHTASERLRVYIHFNIHSRCIDFASGSDRGLSIQKSLGHAYGQCGIPLVNRACFFLRQFDSRSAKASIQVRIPSSDLHAICCTAREISAEFFFLTLFHGFPVLPKHLPRLPSR